MFAICQREPKHLWLPSYPISCIPSDIYIYICFHIIHVYIYWSIHIYIYIYVYIYASQSATSFHNRACSSQCLVHGCFFVVFIQILSILDTFAVPLRRGWVAQWLLKKLWSIGFLRSVAHPLCSRIPHKCIEVMLSVLLCLQSVGGNLNICGCLAEITNKAGLQSLDFGISGAS